MAVNYPKMENAYGLLEDICRKEISGKYRGEEKEIALDRLRDELEIVKRQGSASAYVLTYRALRAVNAKAEEEASAGSFASTVLAYVLGFSKLDPITASPKLYPEFYYGLHGEYGPVIEILTGKTVCEKLWEYFRTYPDKDRTVPANGDYGEGTGVYIGDTVYEDREDDLRMNNFYFGFHASDAAKAAKDTDIFKGEAESIEQSFENRVKLRGLMYDNDLWENTTWRLFREGKLSSNEIISHREDLYEFLMDKGMDSEEAFEITEYIRRGRVKRHGFPSEMQEALKKLKLPAWFEEFCTEVPYLFPRAHTIELLTRKRRS